MDLISHIERHVFYIKHFWSLLICYSNEDLRSYGQLTDLVRAC